MDGNGTIDRDELRTVVTTMLDGGMSFYFFASLSDISESIPDEEYQQILSTVNKRGDGNITWEEFHGYIFFFLFTFFSSFILGLLQDG
jgi:Ca2+-binding EF-hand superfamily protein